jgi:hypothetical protein
MGKPGHLGNAKMRQAIGMLKKVFPRANRVTGEQIAGIRQDREGKKSSREEGEIHTRLVRWFRGKKYIQETIDWTLDPTEAAPGVWLRGTGNSLQIGEADSGWSNEGLLGIRPSTIPPVGEAWDSLHETEAQQMKAQQDYEKGEPGGGVDTTSPNQVHHLGDVQITGPPGQNAVMQGWMGRGVGHGGEGVTSTAEGDMWGGVNDPPGPNDGMPADYGFGQDNPEGHGAENGMGTGQGWFNDKFSPLRYVIGRINKGVAGVLQRFESATAIRQSDLRRSTGRFVKAKNKAIKKKYRGQGNKVKEVRLLFGNLVNNGKFAEAEVVLRQVAADPKQADELVAGMNHVRKVLADLHAEAVSLGIEVGHQENYWPRSVKDYKAYKETIDPYEQGIIDDEMIKARQKLGRALFPQEEAIIVDKLMESFGAMKPSRGRGSRNFKQRKVDQVDMQHQHLYHNEDVALGKYLSRTVEAIEAAKFFGRQNRKLKPGEISPISSEQSIGEFVRDLYHEGVLTEEQQGRIVDLVRARFVGGMQSPGMFVRTVRDIGYMITIANPVSAVVQLGDLGLSAIDNGVLYTMQGIKLVLTGKGIKAYQAGIDVVGQEFQEPGKLGGVLDWMMTYSGFKAVDMFGKAVNVTAAHLKWQNTVKQNPDGVPVENSPAYKKMQAKWEPILGKAGFTEAVADIRMGNMASQNLRMMLFTQVADLQPVSLSEMPRWYLENPNGRIFYMLKTFTIKQINFARQRSIDKIGEGAKSGDMKMVTLGAKELLRFAMLFGLAGAGSDLLQKLMCGEKVQMDDLPDIAIENLLQLAGGSKYMASKVAQDGPGAAFVGSLMMPPLNWINDPAKDMMSTIPKILDPDDETGVEDLKSIRNIPIIGKWFYKTFGAGAEYTAKERRRRKSRKRTEVRNEAMQAILDGDRNSAMSMIQKYNDERPEDQKPIQMKGIKQTIRNRMRKEAAEE